MNRLFPYIVLSLFALIVLHSCSIVEQHSIYNSSIGSQDKSKQRSIFSNADYQETNKNQDSALKLQRIPQEFKIFTFESIDSISFGIEEFPGGKTLFFGPAYIPIIPNLFYPFAYISEDNKNASYHILISFAQSDTIYVDSLKFYRNQKEIFYESIEELEFNDSILQGMYTITSIVKNDIDQLRLFPHKCYLFTFKLKKFTTKEIEIRYRENQLFKVKRKKKIYYKPFMFAS